MPGEGKSWIASNLAVTFAQTGKKVILIDADMRKGRQYTIFEVSPRPGLSNYLSGVVNNEKDKRADDIKEFIQETEIENLSVISAGNIPPNPSELLVSHKMTRLINQLREMYDIIIFDGTPSLLVTDAIILSRLVDMTLLVTAHKETKVDNIDKVKRTIENVGGKVAGVVVNKIPVSSKKYQDAYYYGSRTAKVNEVKSKKNIEIEELLPTEELKEVKKVDSPIIESNKEENDIIIKENEKEIKNINDENKINQLKDKEIEKINPPLPKQEVKKNRTTRKSKIANTTVRRTIKTLQQDDINTINNIIEETMSTTKKKRKSKEPDRSQDILTQINKYMDKQ